jgi:hypothetical protein
MMSNIKVKGKVLRMNDKIISPGFAVALAGVLGLVTPAEADNFRFKGTTAVVEGLNAPNECIFNSAQIIASDGASISHEPPGPPNVEGPGTLVLLTQFDGCNGILLVDADCSAPLSKSEFQVIGNNLDSATLNTTVECFNRVSGGSFNASVALTWTGCGSPIRETESFHIREGGLVVVNSRFSGTSRGAIASGSVSDGITNFFSPNPELGFIQKESSGQVQVISPGRTRTTAQSTVDGDVDRPIIVGRVPNTR